MMTISDEVKSRYVEEREALDELEGFAREYEERFRDSFTPESPGVLSTSERATVLLLSALASARQLTWSIVHAINGGLTPALFLAVRAHCEMTGLVAYALRALRQHRDGSLQLDDLDARLYQLTMGISHRRDEFPAHLASGAKAIRAGDLIKAVDDVVSLPEVRDMFRDCYGRLSEFCHPNAYARQLVGMRLSGRTVHFDSKAELTAGNLSLGLDFAGISHQLFFECFNDATRLIAAQGGHH